MVNSILENRMGVVFQNKSLLIQALTHRSYLNERKAQMEHNERLEYLGDAVLELIVSKYLFDHFPGDPEGKLTEKRSKIVCAVSLAPVAKKLGIEQFLLMSKGEQKDKDSKARLCILEDAFEAIVGALYLDRGYTVAEQFVHRVLLSEYKGKLDSIELQSAKCRLQDATQKRFGVTPTYLTLGEEGPDHDRVFVVGVYFNTELLAKGQGKTKKAAEEQAAESALKDI